jgi:hypothetical protein
MNISAGRDGGFEGGLQEGKKKDAICLSAAA